MNGDTGSGCAPAFIGVILAAGLLLFGVLVLLPAVDTWQETNTQIATINAQRDATIAQMQAQAAIEVARQEAQRDIEIAKRQAEAQVQTAALDVAGAAVDATAGTLRLVIGLGFGVTCLVLSMAGLVVARREGIV